MCQKAAKWGQECLLCDHCQGWFHVKCLSMNRDIYKILEQHESYSWICCNCGLPNIHTSFFDTEQFCSENIYDSLSSIDSLPPDLNFKEPIKASSPTKISSTLRQGNDEPRKINSQKSKPKQRSLKILNVNCQSIRAKLASFQHLLQDETPDVVIGTESWLHENIVTGEIFPSNYQVFRKDRNTGDTHGGVFIAVGENLIAQEEPELDQQDCELKWVSIHVKGITPLYIGAFYRSQKTDSEYMLKLEEAIQKIPKNASIWLLGDFNMPDIDWNTNCFRPGGRYPGPSKTMIDIALDHNLHQVVDKPTRDLNILDLCFTNCPSYVNSIAVKDGISDHDVVVLNASVRPKIVKKPRRKIFIYARADFQCITEDMIKLNDQLTDEVVQHSDVNELWSTFTQTIHESMKKNIPSKMSSSKPSLPWVNATLQKKIKNKRKLYDRARKTGDFTLWDKFKEPRRKIDRELRKGRQDYIRGIGASLQTDNTKPFWNYVKALRREVFGVSSLTSKGRIIPDAAGKAETLNQQFCSVFTNENLTNIPTLGESETPSMPEIEVTVSGVEKLLKNLQAHKASGPDDIPARVLKECAPSISLSTGKLPEDWLNANVTPVYKKGDRTQPSNYRPVSLTCIACKQLEHILHSYVVKIGLNYRGFSAI